MKAANEGAYYTDMFRWLLLEMWMRSAFADVQGPVAA